MAHCLCHSWLVDFHENCQLHVMIKNALFLFLPLLFFVRFLTIHSLLSLNFLLKLHLTQFIVDFTFCFYIFLVKFVLFILVFLFIFFHSSGRTKQDEAGHSQPKNGWTPQKIGLHPDWRSSLKKRKRKQTNIHPNLSIGDKICKFLHIVYWYFSSSLDE